MLAEQTGLARPEPVRGSVRSLLDRSAGLRIDHVVEQVTARRAEPDEAKLLGISRSAPVLALYVSAREASGRPVLALAVAMPGTCTSWRTPTRSGRGYLPQHADYLTNQVDGPYLGSQLG